MCCGANLISEVQEDDKYIYPYSYKRPKANTSQASSGIIRPRYNAFRCFLVQTNFTAILREFWIGFPRVKWNQLVAICCHQPLLLNTSHFERVQWLHWLRMWSPSPGLILDLWTARPEKWIWSRTTKKFTKRYTVYGIRYIINLILIW